MSDFLQCFVPLFVAVDAVGVLPMYLGLTVGVERRRVRSVLYRSFITAAGVATLFIVGGQWILRYLGVTMADFMIAGGVVLFALALGDLLTFDKVERRVDPDDLGAVPLGVPLIVGPAVLTTALLLSDQYGMANALAATVLNVAVAIALFMGAGGLHRLLGATGARVLSKVANLMLAAIAVMMVRRGLQQILAPPG